MKPLLINPPWYRLQGLEFIGNPIGLGYIGAVLEREEGIKSIIWNADFKKGVKPQMASSSTKVQEMTQSYNNYLRILRDLEHPIWQEVKKEIKKISPDIVGISVNTCALGSSLNVARIVKEYNENIPVIFGGPHATTVPHETIKEKNVDFVVRGEGELTMLELVRELEKRKPNYKKIKGLSYKQGKKIIHNPQRPLIKDINWLPFPARHLLKDKKKYPPSVFGVLYASRGCPYRCIFCGSHNTWSRKPRLFSPEYIISEIEYVKEKYKAWKFNFCDDTFPLYKKHAEQVFELIIKKKIDMVWSCETRAEILKEDLVKKMKKAGCHSVGIGIESGSDRIRKLIKKGSKVEDNIKAAKILRKYNINLVTFFMIGFPWETKKEMYETVKLIKKLNPGQVAFNIVTPEPGTELFRYAIAHKLIPKDLEWSSFFHQSPEMIINRKMSKEEFLETIKKIEKIVDIYNKAKAREKFKKEFGFRIKRIIKERLYMHPRLLWNQFKEVL